MTGALGNAGKGERVGAAEKQVVKAGMVERRHSAGKRGGRDVKTRPGLGIGPVGELEARDGPTRGGDRWRDRSGPNR